MRAPSELSEANAVDESDEALVARYVGHGDRDALGELFGRYSGRLRRLLYAMLGSNLDRVQDAEQEVYLTVINRLHRFQGRSSFSTFFYSLARNRTIDLIRKHGRESDRTTWYDDADRFAGRHDDPAHALVAKSGAWMLEAAMRRLRPEDRVLLYLKDGEGERVETLADMTGMATGTVKSRLARARRKLAGALEELGYEGT